MKPFPTSRPSIARHGEEVFGSCHCQTSEYSLDVFNYTLKKEPKSDRNSWTRWRCVYSEPSWAPRSRLMSANVCFMTAVTQPSPYLRIRSINSQAASNQHSETHSPLMQFYNIQRGGLMRRRNFKIQVSARTERRVNNIRWRLSVERSLINSSRPCVRHSTGARVLSALLECAPSTEGPGVQRHLLRRVGNRHPLSPVA